MALKALMLRKKIDDKKKELSAMTAKAAEIEKREKELETAIAEAQTEEDKAFVDGEIEKHEANKTAQAEETAKLEKEVADLEAELSEEEAEQNTDTAIAAETQTEKTETRKENKPFMNKRNIFAGMNMQERTALFEREDVKNWIETYRSAIANKRAVENVGVTIPEVILPLLRENLTNWSKLYDFVSVQQVAGEARQPVMGVVPEAVWTECCANLNELTIVFNDWAMDCYEVAGFFAVCNANLQDSDIDLASEILTAAGQAIGKALDKAIVYGRKDDQSQHMPQGIVPSLLQTAKPANYPATARAWEDLHETHVVEVGTASAPLSGNALFAGLIEASAVAASEYSRGELTWLMNDRTFKKLKAQALTVDAAGTLVAGLNDTMPIVGGRLTVLNFIPDGVVVFGYMDLYKLAERAGREFASSEHVRFLQNQTVYKASARYDGAPIIREAFGVATINGTGAANTYPEFASDTANPGE